MRKFSYIAFFVLLTAYALFQGRNIILGPRLRISLPVDNSLVETGVLKVAGTAKNTSYLTLDDRQIYTDKEGKFEEKLIAQKGINIIKLAAKDRFGRGKVKLVRVVAN